MKRKKVFAQILFVLLGVVCVGVLVTGVKAVAGVAVEDFEIALVFLPLFLIFLAFFFTYALGGNPLTRKGVWKKENDGNGGDSDEDDEADNDDETDEIDEDNDNNYFDGNSEEFDDEDFEFDEEFDGSDEEMFGFEEEEDEDSVFGVPDSDDDIDIELPPELRADNKPVSRKGSYMFLTVTFYFVLAITLLPTFDLLKYAFVGAAAVIGIPAFILFFDIVKYYESADALTKVLQNIALKKQAEQEILPDESVAEEKAEKIEVSENEFPSIAEQAPTEPEKVEPEADKKPKFDDGFMGDKGGYNASGETDEETRKRRGF